jgi:hypothetical protein
VHDAAHLDVDGQHSSDGGADPGCGGSSPMMRDATKRQLPTTPTGLGDFDGLARNAEHKNRRRISVRRSVTSTVSTGAIFHPAAY